MKTAIRLMAVAAGLLATQVAVAQAPAGSTGQCKDGTYSTAASKQGACRGHQGVKEWYAAAPTAAPAPAAAAPKSAAAAAPAAGPKPANATGLCNDGTYATSTSKSAMRRLHLLLLPPLLLPPLLQRLLLRLRLHQCRLLLRLHRLLLRLRRQRPLRHQKLRL
jgi:hypothetical protein